MQPCVDVSHELMNACIDMKDLPMELILIIAHLLRYIPHKVKMAINFFDPQFVN